MNLNPIRVEQSDRALPQVSRFRRKHFYAAGKQRHCNVGASLHLRQLSIAISQLVLRALVLFRCYFNANKKAVTLIKFTRSNLLIYKAV